MIYFDTRPVFALRDDSLTLADGTVITGLHAPELLSDDRDGQEIFAARLALIREKRNRLLTECDWTQLPDTALSSSRRQAWQSYRQALRDLPDDLTQTNIDQLIWPSAPE